MPSHIYPPFPSVRKSLNMFLSNLYPFKPQKFNSQKLLQKSKFENLTFFFFFTNSDF